MEMLSGRPTVSLVIHRSQLLWRVSSLDSWFLDKAHGSAAPCRRTVPYYYYVIIYIHIGPGLGEGRTVTAGSTTDRLVGRG